MSGSWRPYLNDRLIKDRPEGFSVIVPKEIDLPTPLACGLCEHVMRNHEDEIAHREFGCCDRCARLWAHPRRQAWHDGWRPTVEQLRQAENDRPPLSIVFDVD